MANANCKCCSRKEECIEALLQKNCLMSIDSICIVVAATNNADALLKSIVDEKVQELVDKKFIEWALGPWND